MFRNNNETEVELVLSRQPDITDVAFDKDAASVTNDLASLKALPEGK